MGIQVKRFYDVGVSGIHRLFNHIHEIRQGKVSVVIAGMEGALASVVEDLSITRLCCPYKCWLWCKFRWRHYPALHD